MRNPSLLRALARAFLAGEPKASQIAARAGQILGREWRWLRPLAERYIIAVEGKTRPRHRDVVQFFLDDAGFGRAWSKYFHELSVARWLTDAQQMQPVAAAEKWDLPRIESAGALCDWFWLEPRQLEWFADIKGLGQEGKLHHYHYRALTKGHGGVRLVEAPKSRLKKLQRQILMEILDRVPEHPAAHGFVKGRSIKTFAAPHVGQRILLRLDLSDFFPSFAAARIQTIFRTFGYPETVADLLGGLCTNSVPRDLWTGLAGSFEPQHLQDAKALYSRPHLPQGAPTSPSLANICSYRVDCRLAGLAESAGFVYTRYADDLAFSGGEELERRVDRFATHVAAILLEEGFRVNHRKTRIMRRGVRQHLAGVVVNRHMNVGRREYDTLKATLTNCIRLGPGTQDREGHADFQAHLEGKVGFVESINRARGERLRRLLEQIAW
jgi:RNA-directed DNA polymerase